MGTKINQPSSSWDYSVINEDTKIIQIDIDPIEVGRNYPVAVGIVGDAQRVAQQLIEAVCDISADGKTNKVWKSEFQSIARKRIERLRSERALSADPMMPQQVYPELTRALPKGTMVTIDAGVAPGLSYDRIFFEEPRTIKAAINSGQMDSLRQLLAKHADYDRAENAIVTREAGRVDAADTQWLDTVAPLTSDLARSAATLRGQQGTDAANQRVTRENQLGSIEAWEALEKSQQHTIRDISNRDYQKDANGVVVRGPQAAAEMKGNALANAKQQYSNILRQRWGFLIRQGHELEGQEDPEVVQTVTSRLVRAGMRPGQSPQAFIDEQKSEVQEAMQQQGVDNAEALSGVLRESRSILERPSGIRSINIPEVGQGWGGEPLLEPERRLRQLSRPGSGRNPWSSGG